ncbi:MAG: MaoC family dehydratase [Prevotellaceae bacterium]|jgi:acyl dehydratase|nr:MaoC family dehydratase [Prevotellaceae bacterium]
MIKTGDTFTHEFVLSQEDVNTFARITGDNNPIHIDAEFAAKTPFKRPIVHGIFSAAIFSKVFGTMFPGEGSIYMHQDLKFKAPVYAGEPYIAKFEVSEVNIEKHTGVISCLIVDAGGKIYVEGTAKLKNDNQF